MSFLHAPIIAIGSLFIGIPILLHLLMRRKPKPMVFPALRFVRTRQRVTQRRMKLRHLLLLLLRCAALAALAAGLARPFVPSTATGNWLLVLGLGIGTAVTCVLAYVAWSEDGKRTIAIAFSLLALILLALLAVSFTYIRANPTAILVGDDEPPIAAAIILDRSPRMAYQHETESRLAKAKSMATWLLDELPAESDVAILETGSSRAAFSVDRQTASTSVEALEVEYQSIKLPFLVNRAIDLLQGSTHPRKEIYVFTDLTERSWHSEDSELAGRIETIGQDLSIYLVDVGVDRPSNVLIHPPTISAEHISPGSAIEVVTAVSGDGLEGEVDLEVVIELPDPTLPMIVNGEPVLPQLETRGRSTATVQDGRSAQQSFTLRGLGPGIHHGQIRTRYQDGLEVDNARFFSVHVGQPWRVLLIAEPGIYSEFVSGALAPLSGSDSNDSLFLCDTVSPASATTGDLSEYAAVALLDPSPLSQNLWSALAEYVSESGNLAVILGREATPISEFNSIGALSVLPGRLVRQFRTPGNTNLVALPMESHPMLRVLRTRASAIAWNDFPVFRHWELDDLRQSATTVVPFTNGMPMIIESSVGGGRVVTVTTPFTDPLNVEGRDPWNLIPTGPEPWPYVVLVNELFQYLVSDGEAKLNYEIGEVATVETPSEQNANYQLFSPEGAWQPVTPQSTQLVVALTTTPGAYRIRSTADPNQQSGFSVNMAVDETNLTRIERKALNKLLGEDYRIAKTEQEITRDMSEARRGREFYPWLMLFLAAVLGMETLLSNRFYADTNRAEGR